MSKENILVVDDTLANLELLEIVLDENGYEVRTSTSGEMALKSIAAQRPDLILLDIMMPGIDGFETCSRIKQNPLYKDIPVIFLSAKGELTDKLKGFDVGAVDYLAKPFDMREVLVRIDTHLSLYLLKRELERKIEIIDKYVIKSSTDINGVITDVSEAFCEISGYTKEELIGGSHNILRHYEMPDDLYDDLWETVQSGKNWRGEIKNMKKDGSFYWVDAIISSRLDLNNNIIGYTCIRYDITDKKKIEMLSITDQLTGLYNRRHFNDTFAIEIKRSIRQASLLSFIMLDIDFFKQYNDTYGHQDGDTVLSSFGNLLTKELKRSEDFAFRLGGEEFGIIYTTKTCEDARIISEDIRNAIENLKIEHKSSKVSNVITASLGMVCIDFSKESNYKYSSDALYKLADDELYKAKESGRNRLSSKII